MVSRLGIGNIMSRQCKWRGARQIKMPPSMSAPHQNIIVSTIKQLTTNIQVAVFTRSSLTVIKVICQSEIILYISFRDKYTNHKPKCRLLGKKLSP